MSRWYVKKTARRLFVGAWSLLGRSGGQCVRALTYHRFGESHQDPWAVPTQDFEAQIALLADEGRAVSLDDVIGFVAGTKTVPEDACLITIDDGMESTLRGALPILKNYDVPAVAFVSSKLVGQTMPDAAESYMGWDELERLRCGGLVDIGSHAHTHRSLGEMPADAAADEAQTSRELLSSRLGEEIRCFAYPFGMRNDFSPTTDQALSDAGYQIAFNSMHGVIRQGMQPVSLPRIKVEGGDSQSMFARISRGAMDSWRVVDDNLWRLQRVRQEIS